MCVPVQVVVVLMLTTRCAVRMVVVLEYQPLVSVTLAVSSMETAAQTFSAYYVRMANHIQS